MYLYFVIFRALYVKNTKGMDKYSDGVLRAMQIQWERDESIGCVLENIPLWGNPPPPRLKLGKILDYIRY
jgi:hypothetical protein